MSNFEQLHPALQHHIVNSLGWRELRPFQDAVIPSILEGKHMIVLAPTAGGKTEAAFLPAVSRMLSENWSGLSVLYLCPIKALLNNLIVRLQRYTNLLGRRTELWHGDVHAAGRKRILREPPDCLLTTPESLEVMLISPNVDASRLFQGLQAVIIDEVHAFAGDDRGWHLLSVLERVGRLSGREIQRIGLSATVGNPDALVDWLAGSCSREREVVLPTGASPVAADVRLDFVGSLRNAAVVISRLHRGEKRLVFVDSRARAEKLGQELRELDVTAFVTHSSLSPEQRRQAEDAFANRSDCVIVATSVLELGIDVGDLDRVIQIDSPSTVSSLLQRMGRTGRRSNAVRNCLFLATHDETLLQAAALIHLWEAGYVEPVVPPLRPFHVLAQQLLALILQEGGVGRNTWTEWVGAVPAFRTMTPEDVAAVVDHMLNKDFVWDDNGILGVGQAGERTYGRKNFMEILSVFLSAPLFRVLHGRQELGFVDELTFLGKQEGPRVLLLGGRAWRVNYIDWSRKVTYVEETDERGQSRWKGEGQGLGFTLCQAMKEILSREDSSTYWSSRAFDKIGEIRQEYPWLRSDDSVVVSDSGPVTVWWTFSGSYANGSLAPTLSSLLQSSVKADSLTLTFEETLTTGDIEAAIEELRRIAPEDLCPEIDEAAVKVLKFSDCLPNHLAGEILQTRLRDTEGVRRLLENPIRYVVK